MTYDGDIMHLSIGIELIRGFFVTSNPQKHPNMLLRIPETLNNLL